MSYFYHRFIYRNLCCFHGLEIRASIILWVTLTSLIISTAGQGLQPTYSALLKESGIVLSPNYPLNYTNNINYTWLLQSGSNATNIRLQFHHFNTEYRWDELRIYDEKGFVTTFSGNALPPIMTLGRTARLAFSTDNSVNGTGFNASFVSFDTMSRTVCTASDVYWCMNSNKCVSSAWRCDRQLDCSLGEDEAGCRVTSLKSNCSVQLNGSGTILSLNYPFNYTNNINCTWRLQSSSNATNIRLQFHHFNLDHRYDKLHIYDEKGRMTTFSGYSVPSFMTLGKTARLGFFTNSIFNSTGFSASFSSFEIANSTQCTTNDVYWCMNSSKCISSSWRCDGQLDCSMGDDESGCPDTSLLSNCNVILNGSGIILSPNYPFYTEQVQCTWHLQSSSNTTNIRLQFQDFNLEYGWADLRIYDEKGYIRTYNPPRLLTLGRTARLVFFADFLISGSGFNASFSSFDILNRTQCITHELYWCTNSSRCISDSWRCDRQRDCSSGDDEAGCPSANLAPSTTPPCGGTMVDSGKIMSPNYPRNYPNNVRCSWRLLSKSNDTSIRIHFFNFILENNYHDYVTVYDEKNKSQRYTGYMQPPPMLLGKEARIEFYSDESNTTRGFFALFDSINTLTVESDCKRLGKFWCSQSFLCISAVFRCNNYRDCTYGEDESNCFKTTNSPQVDCQRIGTFWCDRSVKCIPLSFKCNNYRDCTYGEDEENCFKTTDSPQSSCQRFGSFWCSRSLKCVPASSRCNNYNDCPYGEDEVGCLSAMQQCQQEHRFWCETSRQCISSLWRCDRTKDCRYGEDEQGCATLSKGTVTAIVAGSASGFIIIVIFVTVVLRVIIKRRQRRSSPRSNNSLQTVMALNAAERSSATVWPTPATYTADGSATVWPTPATYDTQFGVTSPPAGGSQETGGLQMDQYAPPSYDATIKAYATNQCATRGAQSGEVRPLRTPAVTASFVH